MGNSQGGEAAALSAVATVALVKALRDHDSTGARSIIRQGLPNSAYTKRGKPCTGFPIVAKAQRDGMGQRVKGSGTLVSLAVEEFDDDDALEIVAALLDAGAPIDAKDHHQGVAALHMAVVRYKYTPKTLQLLLDRGADPDIRAENGQTPAMLAARNAAPRALRALHEAGADLNLPDRKGRTALDYAHGFPGLSRPEGHRWGGAEASVRCQEFLRGLGGVQGAGDAGIPAQGRELFKTAFK